MFEGEYFKDHDELQKQSFIAKYVGKKQEDLGKMYSEATERFTNSNSIVLEKVVALVEAELEELESAGPTASASSPHAAAAVAAAAGKGDAGLL
jgi:hypothetical protein